MKKLFLGILALTMSAIFVQTGHCFVNLTINGVVYSYPETDDLDWGDLTTSWAKAVSSTTFQKSGGTFTLSAEAYFGAIQGLRAAYFSSKNQPRASTGTFRLASGDTIRWRNVSNSTDVSLGMDSGNNLTWRGLILQTTDQPVIPGATAYIQNTSSLQPGATFFVSSGTVGGVSFFEGSSMTFDTAHGRIIHISSIVGNSPLVIGDVLKIKLWNGRELSETYFLQLANSTSSFETIAFTTTALAAVSASTDSINSVLQGNTTSLFTILNSTQTKVGGINLTGQLAIGKIGASKPLDVQGGVLIEGTTATFLLRNTNGVGSDNAPFVIHGNLAGGMQMLLGNLNPVNWTLTPTSGGNFSIVNNLATRFSIDSSGNVGLGGQTSPAIGLSLVDVGVGLSRSDVNALGLYTNSTERIRILSDGRVGVSTTAPVNSFTVVGDAKFTSSVTVGSIQFVDGSSQTSAGISALYVANSTAGKAIALDVAQATASAISRINQLSIDTGTLRSDLSATSLATGTLQTSIFNSTATKADRSEVKNSHDYDLIVGTRGCQKCDVSIENTAQFNIVKSSFNLGGLTWSTTACASWFLQNGVFELPNSVWPRCLTSTHDSSSVITNGGATTALIATVYGQMNSPKFDSLGVSFSTAQVKLASGTILNDPVFDGAYNSNGASGIGLNSVLLLDHITGAKVRRAKFKNIRGIGGVNAYGEAAALMIHESTGNEINIESWDSSPNSNSAHVSVSLWNSTANLLTGNFSNMQGNGIVEVGGGGNYYRFDYHQNGPFGDNPAVQIGQTAANFGNDVGTGTYFSHCNFYEVKEAGAGTLLRIGATANRSNGARLHEIRFYGQGNVGPALDISANAINSMLSTVKTYGFSATNDIIGSTRATIVGDVWSNGSRIAEIFPSSVTIGSDSSAFLRVGGNTAASGGDIGLNRIQSSAGNIQIILGADSTSNTSITSFRGPIRTVKGQIQAGTYGVADLATSATGLTTFNSSASVFGTLTATGAVHNSMSSVDISSSVRFLSDNTTGAGVMTLGTNSPANTTTPYTWIRVQVADGENAWMPVWK